MFYLHLNCPLTFWPLFCSDGNTCTVLLLNLLKANWWKFWKIPEIGWEQKADLHSFIVVPMHSSLIKILMFLLVLFIVIPLKGYFTLFLFIIFVTTSFLYKHGVFTFQAQLSNFHVCFVFLSWGIFSSLILNALNLSFLSGYLPELKALLHWVITFVPDLLLIWWSSFGPKCEVKMNMLFLHYSE